MNCLNVFNIFLLLNIFITFCHGANILAIFCSVSKSHKIFGMGVIKELARRGHQITMFSAFPINTPIENYTDIYVPEIRLTKEQQKEFDRMISNPGGFDPFSSETMSMLVYGTLNWSEALFKNLEFMKFANANQSNVDLVLIDLFYNDVHFVLGDVFQAPIIPFSSAGFNNLVSDITNNPDFHSYVPNKFLVSSDELSFSQRLKNSVLSTIMYLLAKYCRMQHQAVARKYFPNSSNLEDIINNHVPFVFSNAHYSFETPRPYVPNVINIAGSHIETPQPLTKDLQEILDNSNQDAIFFSLGTNIKSKHLKPRTIQGILNAFQRSKYTVIMKWDYDLPYKPKNVFINKWFPQNDVLAHPKIKAFITHGGLLSTIEAIYHAVPIIGIPIFVDQIANVPQAVQAGYGLQLNFLDLKEEDVYNAIMEIMSNPKYTENIMKRSELLRNQPISPLDLAIHWIEHVLKYKGAPYLQTKAYKLWWFQIYLLDVIAFCLVIFISAIILVFYFIKYSYNILNNSSHNSSNNKKIN